MASNDLEILNRFLAENDLLDLVPDADRATLVKQFRRISYAAGEKIFSDGVPDRNIYWVESGRIKLTKLFADGRELLYGMVDPGDFVGEIAALDGGARAGDAVAEHPTVVLRLGGEALIAVIERNPAVGMAIIRGFCLRVRQAGTRIENLALHNAETRIWSRLMMLAHRYAKPGAGTGSLRIEHGYSQQDLADAIGITRVMVNRQMILWRKRSLIEYGRGYVEIRDPEALEDHVRRGSNRLESARVPHPTPRRIREVHRSRSDAPPT